MNEDDLAILVQLDMWTLADWWCLLNSWKWPSDLPDEEPPERHCPRRSAIMQWIENRIGHRVISRRWNHAMTDEEHEDFWRGAFEGNADARERDNQRRLRACGIVPTIKN